MEKEKLYDAGVFTGLTDIVKIDGHSVASVYAPFVITMIEAAKRDGVHLIVDSGFRTMAEQIFLRRSYCIDKTMVEDDHYIMTADSIYFNPQTGKPGYSNHQNGRAIDFRTRDTITKKLITGSGAPYPWLVKMALAFGFVRTVPSVFDNTGKLLREGERWHWEYRPTADKFHWVKKSDPTWDGLV